MSVFKKILFVFAGLYSGSLFSECRRNPVLCQIKQNIKLRHLDIPNKQAVKLSNLVNKAAAEHKVPARLLAAILMQESKYDVGAKNCSNYNIKTKLSVLDLANANEFSRQDVLAFANNSTVTKKVKKCVDFGIGQINIRTIDAYGFILEKLLKDIEYSVLASAKVLSDFKYMYSRQENDWWTRYNASNPEKRQEYKALVMKYF